MTRVILATFFLACTSSAISQNITVTNTFVDGQTASAAEVNQNFTDLATKVNAIVRKDDDASFTAVGYQCRAVGLECYPSGLLCRRQ